VTTAIGTPLCSAAWRMASRVSGSFTVVRFMVCQHTPTPDSARNRRSGGGPQSRRPRVSDLLVAFNIAELEKWAEEVPVQEPPGRGRKPSAAAGERAALKAAVMGGDADWAEPVQLDSAPAPPTFPTAIPPEWVRHMEIFRERPDRHPRSGWTSTGWLLWPKVRPTRSFLSNGQSGPLPCQSRAGVGANDIPRSLSGTPRAERD
jgi:hypothetical protein